MNSAKLHSVGQTETDQTIVELVEEITDRLQAGATVNLDEYVENHPQFASQLRQLLPTLRAMGDLGRSREEPILDKPAFQESLAQTLGDYRIVREIGRGGMGVVYEAEQVSLGRRVALKILPFAAVLDQKQLTRFKNEAHAAATLHHTNIVPVFGIGCERNVHYYAMQYIAGHTLAEVIDDLRVREGLEKGRNNGDARGLEVTDTLTSVNLAVQPDPAAFTRPQASNECSARASRANGQVDSDTQREVQRLLSTHPASRSHSYYRNIATLGIQVADALQHAHEAGVIHRDIKPSNLIVDTGGKLWVTDFGLARVESSPGLTLTGDLIGTLRYMSPEQAMAKRVSLDERTDVYSWGVTMYELLTLRPAYSGNDRQELLRQIAFEEPRPPRRVNKSIPVELDTIVLKAIEKNPAVRYQTAGAVADDLKRYLEYRPILAKPPSVVQKLRKWSQRHQTLVASAVVMLLLAVVGLTFHNVALSHQRDEALHQKTQAEEQKAEAERQKTIAVRRRRLADALRLAAQSQSIRGEHPIQSLLLAKGSIDATSRYQEPIPPFCQQSLRDALAVVGGRPFPRGSLRVSANSRWLAKSNPQGVVSLYDLQNPWSEEVVVRDDPGWSVEAVSSDKKWVVTWEPPPTLHLWNLRSKAPRIVLTAGEGAYHKLRISPDGRWLAVCVYRPSGESSSVIRLWDLNAPDIRGTLKVLRGVASMRRVTAWDFEFSPDSHWLASTTVDPVVRLWDLTAPDPTARAADLHLGEDEIGVSSLAFSPDSQSLLAGSVARDRTCAARMWDLTKPDPDESPLVFSGHNYEVTVVAFSPDGHWAVTVDSAAIRLWDLHRAEPNSLPIVWRGHQESVSLAAFSPDSRRLVTLSRKTARIWDLNARDPSAHSIVLRGHEFAINMFFFTPDSRWMITKALAENRLWDLSSHALQMESSGQRSNVLSTDPLVFPNQNGRFLGFLRDSCKLYTSRRPNEVRLWDLTKDDAGTQPVVVPVEDLPNVSISADHRWLATGSRNGEVRLLDTDRPDPATSPVVLGAHNGAVRSIEFSRDKRWLATGSVDRTVRVWNLREPSDSVVLRGFETPTAQLRFSADSRRLATVDRGNNGPAFIRVYNLGTDSFADNRPLTLKGNQDRIEHVAFSPDSRWLATGGGNEVRLWDVRDDHPLDDPYVLPGHENPLDHLGFSPDGRWLATGSWRRTAFRSQRQGSVRLWDLSDENFVAKPFVLAGQRLSRGLLRRNSGSDPFAPDSTWLATVGLDNAVHLWNLSTVNLAENPLKLRGHPAMPRSVTFSPDGRWLATGGEHRASRFEPHVRLWDLRAARPANSAVLLRSPEFIGQLTFSPDSRRLAGGSFATVRVWNVQLESLLKLAHRAAGRELTDEESKQFLLEDLTNDR